MEKEDRPFIIVDTQHNDIIDVGNENTERFVDINTEKRNDEDNEDGQKEDDGEDSGSGSGENDDKGNASGSGSGQEQTGSGESEQISNSFHGYKAPNNEDGIGSGSGESLQSDDQGEDIMNRGNVQSKYPFYGMKDPGNGQANEMRSSESGQTSNSFYGNKNLYNGQKKDVRSHSSKQNNTDKVVYQTFQNNIGLPASNRKIIDVMIAPKEKSIGLFTSNKMSILGAMIASNKSIDASGKTRRPPGNETAILPKNETAMLPGSNNSSLNLTIENLQPVKHPLILKKNETLIAQKKVSI